MHSPDQPIRQAFRRWLRTGRLDIEVKYNPWHDPRDGRFTFAPGGPRWPGASGGTRPTPIYVGPKSGGVRPGRGHNRRPFNDPITLEQAFPGLRQAPGGAIIAVTDQVFNLSGPATEAQLALLQNWSKLIENEISALEPGWRNDGVRPLTTVQGHINRLNDLRWKRAATYLRVRGDARPLQVETLRFVQEQADLAYAEGSVLLKAGRLPRRLSDREALGNHVDAAVRRRLRRRYEREGIDSAGAGPVRVNRRENISSGGGDLTYRRPDARIGHVAFDVTLTLKTLRTPQVRGFFMADFNPRQVVIIRPSQIGREHTYIINRPEKL